MKTFLSTFMAAALLFQGQVHASETEAQPATAEFVMAELSKLPGDQMVAPGVTVAELESGLEGLSDEQLASAMDNANHFLAQQQNLAINSNEAQVMTVTALVLGAVAIAIFAF